jgi:Cu(I)/Ag(I) efflux system membrane fusion protein
MNARRIVPIALGLVLAIVLVVAFRGPLGRWFGGEPPAQSASVAAAPSSDAIDHWTCPMHTSVKQSGPGKCPICGMDLVPVTKAQQSEGIVLLDDAKQQLIGVRTAPVTVGPMRSTFRATGRVAYDESRLADVSLKTRGWITKLFVSRTGDRVARGQPLFLLYSPEIYNAEQDLLLAGREPPLPGADAGARVDLLGQAARQKLHLLGVADSEIDAVTKRGTPAESVPIASPAGGYVVEKNVVEGAAVEAGARLYRIAELDKVWIEADVYESDLPRVRAGQAATVTLDYVPGRTFDAKVAYVYPYVDDKTRAGKVRVELANKDLELRPGMYARIELAADLGERVQVPANAVVYTGPRKLVFVDLGGGRFKPQEVTLGAEANGLYEVLGGLSKGDVVATSGVFLLASEARITTAATYWNEADAGTATMPTAPPPAFPAMSAAPSSKPAPAATIWTCPMHPEIERLGPGDCPICGMHLVPKKKAGAP